MSEELAKSHRFTATGVLADASTATHALATVQIFVGEIVWLGSKREVTVHVHGPEGPSRAPNAEPYALLGTKLLNESVLNVDFPAKTLTII